MTALMIACTMGNWDLIQVLVEDFEADLDGPLSRAGGVGALILWSLRSASHRLCWL